MFYFLPRHEFMKFIHEKINSSKCKIMIIVILFITPNRISNRQFMLTGPTVGVLVVALLKLNY